MPQFSTFSLVNGQSINSGLQFQATEVTVQNGSSGWVYIQGVPTVPPYTNTQVVQFTTKQQVTNASIALQGPPGVQPFSDNGGYASLIYSNQGLTPSSGTQQLTPIQQQDRKADAVFFPGGSSNAVIHDLMFNPTEHAISVFIGPRGATGTVTVHAQGDTSKYDYLNNVSIAINGTPIERVIFPLVDPKITFTYTPSNANDCTVYVEAIPFPTSFIQSGAGASIDVTGSSVVIEAVHDSTGVAHQVAAPHAFNQAIKVVLYAFDAGSGAFVPLQVNTGTGELLTHNL